MTSISWTNAAGGVWATPSDWSGGVLPGAADDVTIAVAPAAGSSGYTIDINSNVAVHSVTLNQAAATLAVAGVFSGSPGTLSAHVYLESGTLVDDGLLSGTVTQTGGTFAVTSFGGGDPAEGEVGTLTWQGNFDPQFGGSIYSTGELEVLNGLTLTGANGTGPGTLTLNQGGGILFYGQQTFDNAVVSLGTADSSNAIPFLANYSGGNLTLGTHLIVDASGYGTLGDNGLITNGGLITTVGTANLFVGELGSSSWSFTNAGSIAVNAGGVITIGAGQVTNTGTITVAAGGTLGLNAPITNHGLMTDNGVVALDGSFTTSGLQALQLSYGAGAAVSVQGTLNNAGANLILGSGGAAPNLMVAGLLEGGTITETGGVLIAARGTLSGVTLNGSLTLASTNAALTIENGLTLTHGGSITVTGANDSLNFVGTQTLDNTVLTIGSLAGDTLTTDSTLTLGTATAINLQSGSTTFGGFNGGTIINNGAIQALGGTTLTLANGLVDTGLISLYAGSVLYVANGSVSVSGNGQISLYQSTLELGNFNASQLGEFFLGDSNVAVAGTLTATGDTLNVGANGRFGQIIVGAVAPGSSQSDASIVGGTLNDAGGGILLLGTDTLVGVTYQGTLSVAAPLSNVTLQNVTLQSLNGQGPGALSLTGAGATLQVNGTLDHATLDIGGGATKYLGQTYDGPNLVSGSYATTTLGAHLNVVQVGKYATIGNATSTDAGKIVNDGTITANVAGGQLTLDGGQFINAGTISAASKETVTSAAASFLNTGSIALTSGATLSLNLLNYYVAPPANGTSFDNAGTITLSTATLREQSGAGIPAVPLRNDGTIQGAGLIATQITNFGGIVATTAGSSLVLNQAVTGIGAMQIDAGATLSLLGRVSGQVVNFSANAVLGLNGPLFLGDLNTFAKGDSIDLLKQTATSAAFFGHSIVVTLSNGSTLTLATSNTTQGALTVTNDGHGGSLIGFAGAAHLGANVPDADWNPAPLAALPHAPETGLMDSAFGAGLLHYGAV